MSGGRANNFDFLRIVAALMVVHGHGWALTGGVPPGLWGVPFARVGVDVFFSISGFLVTRSWERTPDLGAFARKRARRILPGLVACVLLSIFVLGPVATRLTAADYFASGATWRYLANIALYSQLYLPGVFEGLQDGGAVNGSLWSLLPEVACYVTVPLLAYLSAGSLTRRRALLAAGALFFGCFGVYLFEFHTGPSLVAYSVDLRYCFVEAPFFLVGSLFALAGSGRSMLGRADLCLLALLLNYGVSGWVGQWSLPLQWLTTPYMVISMGLMSLPLLREAGRFGDVSFGLYLYAFPIQQLVVQFFPDARYPILDCVALTTGAAFLSWHLVEKWPLSRRSGVIEATGRARLTGASEAPAVPVSGSG